MYSRNILVSTFSSKHILTPFIIPGIKTNKSATKTQRMEEEELIISDNNRL
jgi:uncharacterized protein YccT (UPF0319 family)